MSLTLVSSLFDLARRENNPHRQNTPFYLAHGRWLRVLPIPTVIYCDENLKEALPADVAVPCDLESTHAFARLGFFEKSRARHPLASCDPAKDTPLYGVFQRAKIELLRRDVVDNRHQTTHFAWVDFGIAKAVPIDDAWQAFGRLPGRVKLLQYRPLAETADEIDYTTIRQRLAMGYICGPRSMMLEFCDAFDRQDALASAAGFAPHDETLLERVVLARPDLFELKRITDHTRIFSDYV